MDKQPVFDPLTSLRKALNRRIKELEALSPEEKERRRQSEKDRWPVKKRKKGEKDPKTIKKESLCPHATCRRALKCRNAGLGDTCPAEMLHHSLLHPNEADLIRQQLSARIRQILKNHKDSKQSQSVFNLKKR